MADGLDMLRFVEFSNLAVTIKHSARRGVFIVLVRACPLRTPVGRGESSSLAEAVQQAKNGCNDWLFGRNPGYAATFSEASAVSVA